jgi:hypothetical protein
LQVDLSALLVHRNADDVGDVGRRLLGDAPMSKEKPGWVQATS